MNASQDLPIDAASACPIDQALGTPTTWGRQLAESCLIFSVFVLFAGQSPPSVNEAHYLTKAKHFWTPAWCANDLFLASQDAHYVFYGTVGWLTRFLSLPQTAWVGRVLAWSALAWSWQRLSWVMVPRRWASVLTAAFWLVLLEHGHMAGEWVIGGVEAKCFAYALVFLAIENALRQRWPYAWWLLGAATAMHVLVGGWSMLALAVAWCACGRFRPSWRQQVLPVLGASALGLVGIVPALRLNAGVSPEDLLAANWIYVYERLPHHLVFHALPHSFIARHVVLAVVWGVLAWLTPCRIRAGQLGARPLRGFVGAAVGLAVLGAAIDQSLLNHLNVAAGLLRYYWFRLSDALLPMGVALGCGACAWQWRVARPRTSLVVAGIMACLSVLGLSEAAVRRGLAAPGGIDPTFQLLARNGSIERTTLPARAIDWRRVCEWIKAETPVDAVFVTPRHQQTFKWWAERAEVATVKDIPQDARSVLEWQLRRAELAYALPSIDSPFRPDLPYLQKVSLRWRAEWLVIDTELEQRPRGWPRVFPAAGDEPCRFEVYRIPRS